MFARGAPWHPFAGAGMRLRLRPAPAACVCGLRLHMRMVMCRVDVLLRHDGSAHDCVWRCMCVASGDMLTAGAAAVGSRAPASALARARTACCSSDLAGQAVTACVRSSSSGGSVELFSQSGAMSIEQGAAPSPPGDGCAQRLVVAEPVGCARRAARGVGQRAVRHTKLPACAPNVGASVLTRVKT